MKSNKQLKAEWKARGGKPILRKCPKCGDEFKVWGTQNFCSKPCKHSYKMEAKRRRECLECGTTFNANGKERICSPKCKGDRVSKQFRPTELKPGRTLACPQCKK